MDIVRYDAKNNILVLLEKMLLLEPYLSQTMDSITLRKKLNKIWGNYSVEVRSQTVSLSDVR